MLFSHNVKRLASILLLAVLLFNWGGHRLLSDYFEARADRQLQAELDKYNYNDEDLLKIKVAAALPYGVSTEQYERVNGSVEINGVTYTYVKRRFYQDSLELYCIPNVAKAAIKNARDEFSKIANDFLSNNSSSKKASQHAHSAKFSVSDFTDDHAFVWQYKTNGPSVTLCDRVFADLKSVYLSRLDRPPQA